jgi:two-component system response regulator WspF
VRIGILAEHASAAQVLCRTLSRRVGHEVIWIVASGAEALRLCPASTPDVVLIALPLTATEGLEITRQIMMTAPCPILLVTESVKAHAAFVFEAMGQGALDAVDMPLVESASSHDTGTSLLAKLDMVARLTRESVSTNRNGASSARAKSRQRRDPLIVIGASAGGPTALATVLRGLPKDFPAGVIVVQHVEDEFVHGLSTWLSQQSGQTVTVAREDECPPIGRVLVAGAGGHLTLKTAARLGYTAEPRHNAYRPSVDVFFESVSRLWAGDVIGVLLTGMGKDGALGLKALRDRGHYTIAQDEATSAVYGMPKAAAALDAAVDVLPLGRIAGKLLEALTCSR